MPVVSVSNGREAVTSAGRVVALIESVAAQHLSLRAVVLDDYGAIQCVPVIDYSDPSTHDNFAKVCAPYAVRERANESARTFLKEMLRTTFTRMSVLPGKGKEITTGRGTHWQPLEGNTSYAVNRFVSGNEWLESATTVGNLSLNGLTQGLHGLEASSSPCLDFLKHWMLDARTIPNTNARRDAMAMVRTLWEFPQQSRGGQMNRRTSPHVVLMRNVAVVRPERYHIPDAFLDALLTEIGHRASLVAFPMAEWLTSATSQMYCASAPGYTARQHHLVSDAVREGLLADCFVFEVANPEETIFGPESEVVALPVPEIVPGVTIEDMASAMILPQQAIGPLRTADGPYPPTQEQVEAQLAEGRTHTLSVNSGVLSVTSRSRYPEIVGERGAELENVARHMNNAVGALGESMTPVVRSMERAMSAFGAMSDMARQTVRRAADSIQLFGDSEPETEAPAVETPVQAASEEPQSDLTEEEDPEDTFTHHSRVVPRVVGQLVTLPNFDSERPQLPMVRGNMNTDVRLSSVTAFVRRQYASMNSSFGVPFRADDADQLVESNLRFMAVNSRIGRFVTSQRDFTDWRRDFSGLVRSRVRQYGRWDRLFTERDDRLEIYEREMGALVQQYCEQTQAVGAASLYLFGGGGEHAGNRYIQFDYQQRYMPIGPGLRALQYLPYDRPNNMLRMGAFFTMEGVWTNFYRDIECSTTRFRLNLLQAGLRQIAVGNNPGMISGLTGGRAMRDAPYYQVPNTQMNDQPTSEHTPLLNLPDAVQMFREALPAPVFRGAHYPGTHYRAGDIVSLPTPTNPNPTQNTAPRSLTYWLCVRENASLPSVGWRAEFHPRRPYDMRQEEQTVFVPTLQVATRYAWVPLSFSESGIERQSAVTALMPEVYESRLLQGVTGLTLRQSQAREIGCVMPNEWRRFYQRPLSTPYAFQYETERQ